MANEGYKRKMSAIPSADVVGYSPLMGDNEARKSLEKAEILGMNVANACAVVASTTGDLQALQKQLDRGQSNWETAGTARKWYPIFRPAASYLKGDHIKVKEMLSPLWQAKSYVSFTQKTIMDALEGNLDLALDYHEKALTESEYTAIWHIQANFFDGIIFPNYCAHPRYQKMLRDVGLEDESIVKLKMPPLPF